MSTTIQTLSEAIVTRLETLGVNVIAPHATPVQDAEAPRAGASAQVRFLGRESLSPCNEHAKFEILVAVPAHDKDWPASVERLRDYLDLVGDRSIEAAIEGDRTLGGIASDAVATGTDRERLVQYQDGLRWAAPVFVSVYYER